MTASKRTLLGMAEAGEPLLTQALEAIRAYNDALERKRPAAEMNACVLRQTISITQSSTTRFIKPGP